MFYRSIIGIIQEVFLQFHIYIIRLVISKVMKLAIFEVYGLRGLFNVRMHSASLQLSGELAKPVLIFGHWSKTFW